MGSIAKRPDGRYRARWRDLDGKEHAKHFTRKVDASAFLATVEADKLRGQYVDPSNKTTVVEYARRWAATRPHGPRTVRRVDSVIRNHLEATTFGGRRMSRVLPSDAQAWVSDRAKVLAPVSLEIIVNLVRSIFKAAVLDRVIGQTPFAKVSLPEAHTGRIVPLTVAQVRTLAAAMPDRCEAMVITQAGLGLRIGELLALRKQDVDFLRRSVRVEWQIPPDSTVREAPKTPWSKRSLPLPQFVADALAAHIRAYPPLDDGSLFSNTQGRVWTTSHYLGKIFRPAVKRSGLPSTTTSHDLRHHYASVLLHGGESVIAVAERLGHKNGNLVIKTYGHMMPDSEERTRKAMDAAWSADQVRTSGSSKAV